MTIINNLQLCLALCLFKSRVERILIIKILRPKKSVNHPSLIHSLASIKPS